MKRRAKIVCTLGPAVSTPEKIRELVRAGAERGDGAPEPEPVPRHDVALGDRHEAREARFRGKEVVAARLGVNFLVIGLAAGAMWRFRGPPPLAAGITPNLLGYASTLPPERRKALWDQTEAERLQLRPFRREVRTAREDTIKALMAEPFDRDKFLASQVRQGDAEHRARAAVQNLYAKIASGLTLEERRAFPRWREHRRPPGQNLLDEPDQTGHQPAKAK